MGEGFTTPRDGLCSSPRPWVPHRMLGLSQGKACQDALSVSEVKASPCPPHSLSSPWKTSQALRTQCRTNRGGMAWGEGL